MHNKISHSGIIDSIIDNCVKVRILQTSACAACKVAGHCNAAESKEKIIDVLDVSDTSALRVGDEVTVWASRDVANHALLLGFGVPFLVLVGVLFLVIYITHNEGLAALSALLALVPYYAVLFLCRDRIRERLSFHIE
ncbi:MAG: SoxR reducing system RseC family protein [Prevotella sp.]|nr:SoxR reducing system RseC family protein [Prevotella sp.]